MTNFRTLIESPTKSTAWSGEWTRIWVKPDIFSAQEYIVGAVAVDNQEIVHDFRVLSGADRFECIYGEGTKSFFEATLSELRAELTKARAQKSACSTLTLTLENKFRFERVGSLRCQLPSESLERMFRDGTIPLEPEEPKGKKKRFINRNPNEVVKKIIDQVKLKAGFSANEFLIEDHFEDQSHDVAVNLVNQKSAGIIASGWFASPERIQLELLRAGSIVEAYAAATKKENAAVFFCRPTVKDGLNNSSWMEVEKKLDELQWRLKQKGTKVVSHEDEEYLAESVVAWSRESTI